MEKPSLVERTLVAFTITFLATAPAHASHPPQQLQTQGPAGPRSFVGRSTPQGLVFARQVLPAPPSSFPSDGGALSSRRASPRARSRTIYLNRDGALLRPGDNDARLSTSSIVQEPTLLAPWEIDDEMWSETVACMRDLYARFDVTITDEDPGDVPHIEAVFGGHPNDVGLPSNVAGVSPFTTDCSVIENSVVFTFTDVLPDDPRLMCEIMAQEIAHSFGLDHELLAEDPMTYLPYPASARSRTRPPRAARTSRARAVSTATSAGRSRAPSSSSNPVSVDAAPGPPTRPRPPAPPQGRGSAGARPPALQVVLSGSRSRSPASAGADAGLACGDGQPPARSSSSRARQLARSRAGSTSGRSAAMRSRSSSRKLASDSQRPRRRASPGASPTAK